MTMKIVVKNEDPGRTATVTQEDFNIGESQPSSRNTTIVGPNSEKSFYIHASNRLVVTEDPLATQPKS